MSNWNRVQYVVDLNDQVNLRGQDSAQVFGPPYLGNLTEVVLGRTMGSFEKVVSSRRRPDVPQTPPPRPGDPISPPPTRTKTRGRPQWGAVGGDPPNRQSAQAVLVQSLSKIPEPRS